MKTWKETILSTPRRKQAALTGAIVIGALLTSASIFATGPSADPEGHTEKAWPVSVTPVKLQNLRPNFAAFGRVESNRVARLRSKLAASVAQVEVREGDWVQQHQVLVQLDDAEYRLNVAKREADLLEQEAMLRSMQVELDLEEQSAEHFESRQRVAQAKLKRHQDLIAKRLIARSLLDEITSQANEASIEYRRHISVLRNLPNQIAARRAGVSRAEAQLAQANIDLENTTIRAPFSGPVLAVNAAPGDHSIVSLPLIEVADAAGFEVRVQVPDDHAFAFRGSRDNPSAVTARTKDGQVLSLSRITNHVKTGQTGLDAFFTFTASDMHEQALGRVFNVIVEMPIQERVIAVPVQSIYENNRIYTVVDQRLVAHQVDRIGEHESLEHGYRVLIADPTLTPGEAIITTQLPKAISGLLVRASDGSGS